MEVVRQETTSQVLVKAYALLEIEGLECRVKERNARIKKAEVYWFYEDGEWIIDFIHIWGPVIRKKDGAESTQHISETCRPGGQQRPSDVATPPELVKAARTTRPDWTPVINDCPYPRTTKLKSSL